MPNSGSIVDPTTRGSRAEIVPVRSSNGLAEFRPVIATEARIGGRSFEIRLLPRRRAVRNRFPVDPGRSILQPYDHIEGGEGS